MACKTQVCGSNMVGSEGVPLHLQSKLNPEFLKSTFEADFF